MPPSVHIILIHGYAVIRELIFPIGYYSEEPLEGGNKDFRNNRDTKARQNSKINNNADIFKRHLANSDPLMSSQRKIRNKKKLPITAEMQSLLQPQTTSVVDDAEDDETEVDLEEDDSREYFGLNWNYINVKIFSLLIRFTQEMLVKFFYDGIIYVHTYTEPHLSIHCQHLQLLNHKLSPIAAVPSSFMQVSLEKHTCPSKPLHSCDFDTRNMKKFNCSTKEIEICPWVWATTSTQPGYSM